MSASEGELLRRAQQGDSCALARLLERHAPGVRGRLSIRRRYRGVLEIDDVMQVTYLEVFQHIETMTGGPASFPRWLFTVARNNLRDAIECLDREKRRWPARRIVVAAGSTGACLQLTASSEASPFGRAARAELCGTVERYLERLPRDYCQVLQLLYFDGMSPNQAAATMGRTRGAVHLLRIRAIQRLRRLMGRLSTFLSK